MESNERYESDHMMSGIREWATGSDALAWDGRTKSNKDSSAASVEILSWSEEVRGFPKMAFLRADAIFSACG
jgi:hypothetical protein